MSKVTKQKKTKKTPEKRSRSWMYTWNNYTDEDIVYLRTITCRYHIWGKELAPTTKTPHLQGFIMFENARSWNPVRKLLKEKASIRAAKWEKNAAKYSTKEGNFEEVNPENRPFTQKEKGAKGKDFWDDQLKKIKEGKHDDLESEIQIKFAKIIDYIYLKQLYKQSLEDTEEKHLWYYGDTGTGKSRKARTDNPEAYLKMCNKWWDNYKQEDVVIIEDFDKVHKVLAHHMKIWGDRYPFLAEIKGGSRKIRPKKLIVTSNYHPDEIWEDNKDLNPILRRFKVVHFGKDNCLYN